MLKEAIADRRGGEVARSAKLLVSKSHILDSHPKKNTSPLSLPPSL